MANKLNGFLDNLVSGALSPKGNLGDQAHAARLYVDDAHRLSPKSKFLYHVSFNLNPEAVQLIPQLKTQEINMLVKSVDLPKYQIATTLKHQYNKKRNLQTRLDYDPINIVFHDDNFGQTTAMWEAYYRYYFRDGNYAAVDGSSNPNTSNAAYNRGSSYQGEEANNFRYGMDNDSLKPFFESIQIYQMSRKRYTAFTLVNPLISEWGHDTMDNSSSDAVANNMTIQYETVWYARGPVKDGSAPKSFGSASGHYDQVPSPNSLSGGGTSSVFGVGGIAGCVADVFGDISSGAAFSSPTNFLGTVLKATSISQNAKSLGKEGLRQEGFGILKDQIGKATGIDVSGVANLAFPKSGGSGGSFSTIATVAGLTTLAGVASGKIGNPISSVTNFLKGNPGAADDVAKSTFFKKDHINNGGSPLPEIISAAYEAQTFEDKKAARDKAISNANGSTLGSTLFT